MIIKVVYFLAPYILGFLAFVSSLRAFIWVGEKIEGRLNKDFRINIIRRVDKWWNKISETPFPMLARVKTKVLLSYIDNYFNKIQKPLEIKLTFSFLLSALAYLIGHSIQFVFVSKDYFLNGSIDLNSYKFFLFTNPIFFPAYILLSYRLFSIVKQKNFEQSALYLYLVEFIFFAVGSYSIKYYGFSYKSYLFLFIALNMYLIWLKVISKMRIGIQIGLLILLTLILIFFSKRIGAFSFTLILLFSLNYIFDFSTFKVNYSIYQKMTKGNSYVNFFWLVISLISTALLALLVYIFVLLTWELEGYFLSSGWRINNIESLFDLILQQTNHSINQDAYCIILYSATTFIPIIVLTTIFVMSFSAKATLKLIGNFSKFLFFTQDVEKKKTPIYMTIVLIAFWLSIIPGIIAFISTANTIGQLTS